MRSLLWLCLLASCTCGSPAFALDEYSHPQYDKVSRNMNTGITQKFDSLEAINRFANRMPYVPDAQDSWEPPAEFFNRGGDCEDYALAKYALAKENGFTDGHVVLAIDRQSNQAHALFVYDNMVYDNQVQQPVPMELATRYEMVGIVKM